MFRKLSSLIWQELYSSENCSGAFCFLQLLTPKVTEEMNMELIKPVSEEEIYSVIGQMNVDKTPGLDGMNVGFYKHHWKTICKGVVDFVKHFFTNKCLTS